MATRKDQDQDATLQGLRVEQWPIERITPYARNPRRNDAQVDRMAGAIREFGFRIPIVARSDGTVVDGHLRLKAAQKLGLETVPVALADELTEAQEAVVTQPGDVWLLGRHRLMCGDSTDAGSVALLMAGEKADMVFTDPPYNVDYTGKTATLNALDATAEARP